MTDEQLQALVTVEPGGFDADPPVDDLAALFESETASRLRTPTR